MGAETPAVEPAAAPSEVVEEQKPVAAPPPASPAMPETDAPASAATPLAKLFKELPAVINEADHNEMWGVTLADSSHIPTTIVLEKFLRANTKDVSKAKAQLIEALKWRKRMEPEKLLDAEHDAAKFGDLGYVTVYDAEGKEGPRKEIITWNIYGAVKDIKATFGDIQEYPLPHPSHLKASLTAPKIHPLALRPNGALPPPTRPRFRDRAHPRRRAGPLSYDPGPRLSGRQLPPYGSHHPRCDQGDHQHVQHGVSGVTEGEVLRECAVCDGLCVSPRPVSASV